ncbi:hypothetical protein [Cysteiniphilum sp. QT6929]|uniref:hypothetical protein n=1 Tax=Cysteiniphilum TaxID=2056696 RepID=UPI0024B3B466|nr:hypothetical protein [Cysteiniphilum sp. QT6929]WHN65524.1 hypothetical protein NYP54_10890 [Cysteiniphilum sp. QT6929]
MSQNKAKSKINQSADEIMIELFQNGEKSAAVGSYYDLKKDKITHKAASIAHEATKGISQTITNDKKIYSFSLDQTGKGVLELENFKIKADEIEFAVGDNRVILDKKSFVININNKSHIILDDNGIQIKTKDDCEISTNKYIVDANFIENK